MAPIQSDWAIRVRRGILAISAAAFFTPNIPAQDPCPASVTVEVLQNASPVPFTPPAATPCDKPLPINLPTALQLGNVRGIDIALASQRIELAVAQLERARVLWLPNILWGVDYYRHDGRVQDSAGRVNTASYDSFIAGVGPNAVFAVGDAIFGPLYARQVVTSRRASLEAAANDNLLAVAESYFNVQQARGELAGAEDTVRRTEELVHRANELAPRLVPPLEAVRARTELDERRQALTAARERWRLGSAELMRILRLDPAALVEPLEPPHLRVTLVALDRPVDDLIAIGLTNRPELAAQQALVQATLTRLRQERLRPLIPSVLLRGVSTRPDATLAEGVFGGGINGNYGFRNDIDLQVLWRLDNLGFGNRALVDEARAENRLAALEWFNLQDRVAAEVARAHAQAVSAEERVNDAESGLKNAVESVRLNFEALSQTRQAGNLILLVVRPQEVQAAIQALARAYANYYAAVADANRAQFRLYRAMGQPAQVLLGTFAEQCSSEPRPLGSGPVPPVP
jgi:outer membrane protein TolC